MKVNDEQKETKVESRARDVRIDHGIGLIADTPNP